MTDYGTAQGDAGAYLELLRARAHAQGFAVFPAEDGGPTTVPDGTEPPYVSCHFVTQNIAGGRLDIKSTGTRTRAYAHCVGQNDIAARAMLDQVQAAWLDVRPDIDGRSCDPIRHEQTRETDTAEPVARSVVTLTAVYVLETWPGPRS